MNKNEDSTYKTAITLLIITSVTIAFKYILAFILGALMGFTLYYPYNYNTKIKRLKTALFGLTFYASITYLLFGSPIEGSFKGLFHCTNWYEKFNNIIFGANFYKYLNGIFLPSFPIQYYFWFSVFISIVVWILFLLLEVNGKIEPKKNGIEKISRIPITLGKLIFVSLISGWFYLGFKFKIYRNKRVVFSLSLITILWLYAENLAPIEFRITIKQLLILPIFSFIIGFILSFLPIKPLMSNTLQRKKSGFILGIGSNRKNFILTEENLTHHVQIIAPTGSGKTNILKNLIEDRVSKGHGIIFIDFKGEFELALWVFSLASAYERSHDFRFISLADPELSIPFNPIKDGTALEIHSQLMNAMTWSEDFYRKMSSHVLLTILSSLCEHRDRKGEKFHLGHIHTILEKASYREYLCTLMTREKYDTTEQFAKLNKELTNPQSQMKIAGLVANLALLNNSAAGKLMTEEVERGSFDLKEATNERRISYFLINSLKLRESATMFGKLILSNFLRIVGDRYSKEKSNRQATTLIIDEFANFAIPQFIELMDRARGANLGIVIAHQSRADLQSISPEFKERIEANANTCIISGIKSKEDADHFSAMLGTKTTTKETVVREKEFLILEKDTGRKSARDVEEYVLHPNRLRELNRGEVVAICRTVNPHWDIVKIPKAKEYTAPPDIFNKMQEIKNSYHTNTDTYLPLKISSPKKILESTEKENPITSSEEW